MKETVYYRVMLGIIRHFISAIATVLVAKGWIDSDTANEFTASASAQIVIGLIAFLTTLYFSYKDKIWEFVKTRVGIALPPNATMEKVVAVAHTVEDKKAVATGESVALTGASDAR